MTTWDNFNLIKFRDLVGFFIDSVTIIVGTNALPYINHSATRNRQLRWFSRSAHTNRPNSGGGAAIFAGGWPDWIRGKAFWMFQVPRPGWLLHRFGDHHCRYEPPSLQPSALSTRPREIDGCVGLVGSHESATFRGWWRPLFREGGTISYEARPSGFLKFRDLVGFFIDSVTTNALPHRWAKGFQSLRTLPGCSFSVGRHGSLA